MRRSGLVIAVRPKDLTSLATPCIQRNRLRQMKFARQIHARQLAVPHYALWHIESPLYNRACCDDNAYEWQTAKYNGMSVNDAIDNADSYAHFPWDASKPW